MSVRAKVGSYILDAAESGGSSTTTGVRMLTNEGPGLRISVGQSEAQVIVPVQVVRDTTANLKTSVDALVAAVTANVNADLVLEYTSGSTLVSFLTSTGAWSKISATVDVSYGDTSAYALITFTAERIAPATGTAGDATDSLGPLEWTFGLDSNGRASVIGTVTFQTRADANTWINTVRSGTRPSWMNTAMRFLTSGVTMQQQPNQASPVPESAYTPAIASVVFRALPGALAASSAFTNINDVDYTVTIKARPPLPESAGAAPGFDVTISGTLQMKTDTDATWDSNDTTSVAANAVKSTARAAVDAIVSDAQTRAGTTFTRLDEPEYAIAGARGEVAFVVTAVADLPGGVIAWEESTTLKRITRNRRLDGTKGIRVFKHANGPLWKCFHSLAITSLSLPVYTPPAFINEQTWDEDEFTPGKPEVTPTSNGTRIYTLVGAGEWTRVGEDPNSLGYDYATLEGAVA